MKFAFNKSMVSKPYVTIRDYNIFKSMFSKEYNGNCTLYLETGEIVAQSFDGDTFKEVDLKMREFIYKYEQYVM